jgi:hypothetical protein
MIFFSILTLFNGFQVSMAGNWNVPDFIVSYIGLPPLLGSQSEGVCNLMLNPDEQNLRFLYFILEASEEDEGTLFGNYGLDGWKTRDR